MIGTLLKMLTSVIFVVLMSGEGKPLSRQLGSHEGAEEVVPSIDMWYADGSDCTGPVNFTFPVATPYAMKAGTENCVLSPAWMSAMSFDFDDDCTVSMIVHFAPNLFGGGNVTPITSCADAAELAPNSGTMKMVYAEYQKLMKGECAIVEPDHNPWQVVQTGVLIVGDGFTPMDCPTATTAAPTALAAVSGTCKHSVLVSAVGVFFALILW
eukprot:gnl/TRDRNA2_/TRDRNA2_80371_c0_seq1.p1 gnl/TRDRNA2_/TRDRNA2_80371_c0~~gnl/TRDRNA2_/TRDRNA2_80371_c0_seq1.p1  ORF type:complete len:222 (-),score=21.04 gnl/TRDRNA2_/TRDRNA2_80371_c0_seq1:276-908(-)